MKGGLVQVFVAFFTYNKSKLVGILLVHDEKANTSRRKKRHSAKSRGRIDAYMMRNQDVRRIDGRSLIYCCPEHCDERRGTYTGCCTP